MEEPANTVRRSYLSLLVFVVGAASLGTEIAAARLLAPYFGASTIVWANTIGVVLVALAVGYWGGGRLADRYPRLRPLLLVMLGAAGLLALVPFAARPFLSFSLDAFDTISVSGFLGSLFGVLVLVAVPVTMLGAAAPWALRLALDDVRGSGRIAGRLYALSTAGSLLGTMLAALVLIPLAGTQRTFILFAAALALVAATGLGWRFLGLPALLVVALLLPAGTIKGSDSGRVIYETETPYQYARVIEQLDGERTLELNEGQAVHSLYRPGEYLTGDYWDGFLALPFAVRRSAPDRVAMLGNAAGTTARAYGHFFPRTRFEAVEIDPELTEIGRRYFDLRNPNMNVFAEDARPWLARSPGPLDVIMIDAYRQPYVPFYLTTVEFFSLAAENLSRDGSVVINVGHPEGQHQLERVLGRTLNEIFPFVMRDPVTPANTLLVASSTPFSAGRLLDAGARLPAGLRPTAIEAADRLAPRLPGGEIFTDDRAPVEWLVDESLLSHVRGE